jgi:hypothetical protein
MKFRDKNNQECTGSRFNLSALSELIVYYEDGECDSISTSELIVFLEKKRKWKSLYKAMKDHDIITDNYNTYILEPSTFLDRERGYLL